MSTTRNIIKIDEELCTGCGDCVIGCPEGAIKIIDGKARLVSENYSDGLGACIGECPVGAITVETREAQAYEERSVIEEIARMGKNTIEAHLRHLDEHGEMGYLKEAVDYLRENNFKVPPEYLNKAESVDLGATPCNCGNQKEDQSNVPLQKGEIRFHGCPGSLSLDLSSKDTVPKQETKKSNDLEIQRETRLRNWPIQLKLAPVEANYFNNADLLISADCVGSSHPNFHNTFVEGRTLLMGCPKLDDAQYYVQKLSQIFEKNSIRSITILMMEVPCCSGSRHIVDQAIQMADKSGSIPVSSHMITIRGKIKNN